MKLQLTSSGTHWLHTHIFDSNSISAGYGVTKSLSVRLCVYVSESIILTLFTNQNEDLNVCK